MTKRAAKRKLDRTDDHPTTPNRRPSKQQRTSAIHEDDSDDIISPSKSHRRKSANSPDQPRKHSKHTRNGLNFNTAYDRMYTFTSTRPKPNGVIDLTKSPSEKRKLSLSAQKPNGFHNHTGPKKLIVKNLQSKPRINAQEYLDRIWQQEDVSLDAIFRNEKEPYSLEELYRAAENVCRQDKAADLYKRVKAKCSDHLMSNVRSRLARAAKTEAKSAVLKAFVDEWQMWKKQLLVVRQIFYYMDQSYLLRSEEPSLTDTGYQLFREDVFEDTSIRESVLRGATELVDVDRDQQSAGKNNELLQDAIELFHELGVYSSDFEPGFLETSEQYYRNWRGTQPGNEELRRYATNCTILQAVEMKRCDVLNFDRSTKTGLSELFDKIFVEEQVNLLTNEDFVMDMLEGDMTEELEQTYSLLERKGMGDLMAPLFSKYVETEGSLIVFDEKNEADMVINLLNFKRRLDTFLEASFHKSDTIGNALHKSFETFMNKTKKSQANWDTDNAKPGEMIAKHIDLLLKGGAKAIPKLVAQEKDGSKGDEEQDFDNEEDGDQELKAINHHLSNALDLFRFVHGKAVFEAFYKKDLARRLLMGRSASFDAERNMLTRLKNECGQSFTHNLESMFKDMDLAREEMMSYRQLQADRGEQLTGPDLSVNVLSAAAWPTYPDVPVNVPTSIAYVQSKFDGHYTAKHSGRKLTFKHALAHCQLRANFPKGRKELVVSGFQAIVLLLFNDVASTAHLSYDDLSKATGLSDAELKRTLQSLACAKYRVLTKHPKGRDVNTTDTFSFSTGFQDPKMRIKINQIQLKETKEENKETHERVAADRHYETQAAIVRIMKSRKSIGHNELIVEVIKATRSRGVLEQGDIRRNIEKLIEKEYMEREDGNRYSYVA
ncbi:Cullin-4A [Cyphellophora attinorum]|uniref:Cullin-4A n=1 Tax=Cyphellophora attinorum TaxID=1664694 RepID=A0A0N0NKN1_9EURO|nr:Cullin-4A [Phialophora attinorum]KPI38341.1 Cullin-4A [Phialophora attinorum]